MSFTGSPRVGSIRVTVSSRLLATHTAPAPAATAIGPFPTGMAAPTARLADGLTCSTDGPSEFTTHTDPNPTARPTGDPATGMLAATFAMDGSMRTTLPPVASATHTAPAPEAMAEGRNPRGTSPTGRPVAASRMATESDRMDTARAVVPAPPPPSTNGSVAPINARTATIAAPTRTRRREGLRAPGG